MHEIDANGKGDINLPNIYWAHVKSLPANANVKLSNHLIEL